MDKFDIVFMVTMCLCAFILGILSIKMYDGITNKRAIDGLLLRNYDEVSARETADNLDSAGDWVCVNIKGMNFERALKVCRHEVGHEIFAEFCEQSQANWEECNNLTR